MDKQKPKIMTEEVKTLIESVPIFLTNEVTDYRVQAYWILKSDFDHVVEELTKRHTPIKNFVKELKYYLENTPHEEVVKAWNECFKLDDIGITVAEFLQSIEI